MGTALSAGIQSPVCFPSLDVFLEMDVIKNGTVLPLYFIIRDLNRHFFPTKLSSQFKTVNLLSLKRLCLIVPEMNL